MRTPLILLATLTLFIVMVALVPRVPRAATWDGEEIGRVRQIEIDEKGQFSVRLVGTPAPALCSSAADPTGAAVLVGNLGVTTDGVRSMLAVAISAQLGDKRIQVFAKNNPSGPVCQAGAMRLLGE